MSNLTRHSRLRARQRCISRTTIDEALDWGDPYPAGSGCTAWFLGRRAAQRASRHTGTRLPSGVLIIQSADGQVVTVMHAARPGRRR